LKRIGQHTKVAQGIQGKNGKAEHLQTTIVPLI
jgi:hypothetical protein